MIQLVKMVEKACEEELFGRSRDLRSIIYSVVFFLLGNGYAFWDYSPVHDGIVFAVSLDNYWQIRLGRFLMPLYLKVRGDIPAPVIICALAAVYLSISLCLVVRILNLTTNVSIFLVCGFLAVNPFTFEITTVHQYFADVFLLSLMFACLAVYLLLKEMTLKKVLCSAVCFFISFGIYPAFSTFAACLLVVSFLNELYEGDTRGLFYKQAVKVWILGACGFVYIICCRLSLKVLNINAAKQNWSIFTVGRLSTAEVIQSIVRNYRLFANLFLSPWSFLGVAAGISSCLLLLAGLIFFVFSTVRSGKRACVYISILIVMILLFPMGSRLVNIMTEDSDAYRTMYAQFLIWPVVIWLIHYVKGERQGECGKKVLAYGEAILSSAIILSNIMYNNGGCVYKKILYNRTEYHTGQVLEDLKHYTDGDLKDKRIAVVGVFELQTKKLDIYEKYTNIGGLHKDTGITYEYVFPMMASLMGVDLNASTLYSDDVRLTKEVKNMPCYPLEGYISEVDDYLVIKLSD